MKLLYKREDDNKEVCLITWRPTGTMLAVSSASNHVILYDRKGDLIDALECPGKVLMMQWDCEGDVLAVIVERSTLLVLWDTNTRHTEYIETVTTSKELPTCIAWSRYEQMLVVGTTHGHLLIYNHKTQRKMPIMGKHQRRIIGIDITREGKIVCAGDDNAISICSREGDTENTVATNGEPMLLKTYEIKRPPQKNDVAVSAVMGRRVLLLSFFSDIDNSVNLQFHEKYGNITNYAWFSDGNLLVCFEKGWTSCISAARGDIGNELFSTQDFKAYFTDVAISDALNKVFLIGDHQIKSRDSSNLNQIVDIVDVETEKDLSQIVVTEDGSMVAVASTSGTVCVYLTKMPSLAAAYSSTVAVLTSLNKILISPDTDDKKDRIEITVAVEPSLIALGPAHLAVAANNRVWFYDYVNKNAINTSSLDIKNEGEATAVSEYLSTVLDVKLNEDYAAVFMEGKVRLHKIVDKEGTSKAMTFPEASRKAKLLSAALVESFLIFSTDNNYIVHFSLEEWAVVSEYRHTSPIRKLFTDFDGMRICLFDERMDTYIYSPLDDSMEKLPPVGSTVHYKAALFESFTIDKDTFVVYDNQAIYVFLLSSSPILPNKILYIGSTKLPHGHAPLMLSKGIIHCKLDNGKVSGVLLDSHRTDTVLQGKTKDTIRALLQKALVLNRWPYAWRLCEFTGDLMDWNHFAQEAMKKVNVELAIRIFRHIGDVSMVFALEELLQIEETNLLVGHMCVLLANFDDAEAFFMKSSQQIEALHLRRDLLEWPRALVLAEQLAPKEIPFISKEYAQQLEFMGDYAGALSQYENGVIELKQGEEETEQILEHNEFCRAGEAKMSIRTGDIRRGAHLARELEGRQVKRDCALALEQLKQYSEAAELYEIGQYYDRAAAVCIKAKAWGKVGELLPKVRSPKIHAQYGKVMEGEKKYKQAAIAYKNARDYDNLVKILLNHLNMAEEAVKIVRESRSIEGAKHVAQFFSKLGDYSSAIQFLIMSQCQQEAFQMAENLDRMVDYADAIEESGTADQLLHLADWFAGAGDKLNAGRFYLKSANYSQALDNLLSCGDNSDAIRMAVECVGQSKDEVLLKKLTNFLMGDEDGVPKDAKYLFRMYVAVGKTKEAARTAVVIAKEETERGSYKEARNLLFAMYQGLVEKRIKVPQDMENMLMLLHSYLLIRPYIKRDETRAARLLIRVVNKISQFPIHIVNILTSAVVMCAKAGLRASALKFAVMLMAPEYRAKIDPPSYKRKIEALVRKSEKPQDIEDPRSPCPYCNTSVSEMELSCATCKNTIPACILTGRHIVANDFAVCPSCGFPGYYSEFKKWHQEKHECPMCNSALNDVIPGDCGEFLRRWEGAAEM